MVEDKLAQIKNIIQDVKEKERTAKLKFIDKGVYADETKAQEIKRMEHNIYIYGESLEKIDKVINSEKNE
ncbi:MAG: hypothetical protein ABIJ08_02050 [Nanoarchaeota archaeon]